MTTINDKLKVQLTVTSDAWNTLWLIQKTLNEGRKKDLPIKIEIIGGSVESTISVLADFARVGSFVLALVVYLSKKRKQKKPLQIIRFNRDTAYAYVKQHMLIEDIPSAKLITENPTAAGGYFFEFKDEKEITHRYTLMKNFDVVYSKLSARAYSHPV